MLPQNNPDRIRILFDDHRLVANAGLLLPATLARHLGLGSSSTITLTSAALHGGQDPLVASALAGGDCIDDADALRAGGTVGVLGCVVKAPSTLGTFLRSFRWGHVRQLDRVSRQLLARCWGRTRRLAPDHRPGLDDLRDLWTGRARHHGYTGADDANKVLCPTRALEAPKLRGQLGSVVCRSPSARPDRGWPSDRRRQTKPDAPPLYARRESKARPSSVE